MARRVLGATDSPVSFITLDLQQKRQEQQLAAFGLYLHSSLQAPTWSTQLCTQSGRSLRKTAESEHMFGVAHMKIKQVQAVRGKEHMTHLAAQRSSQERQDGWRHRRCSRDHHSHTAAQAVLQSVRPQSGTLGTLDSLRPLINSVPKDSQQI